MQQFAKQPTLENGLAAVAVYLLQCGRLKQKEPGYLV